MNHRITQVLESPRMPLWAALLALAMGLPSLLMGEVLDDHLVRANTGVAPIWDHFEFPAVGDVPMMREHGTLGWWSSSDFSLHFLRPISSLTHSLDHAAWPDAVWLMHLENVLIYALLTWVVSRLVLRVHGPGLVTGIAGLVFAIDESHAASLFIICGRNTLIAAVFGVLAIHAHLRWRDPKASEGRGPWAIVGPLCLICALLSAEAGLCAFGYLVAWSLCCERGRWGHRLAPLLPYVVVLLSWRAYHVFQGYGAVGSSMYLEVGRYPLSFIARALVFAPGTSFAQLTLPVADLILFAPELALVFAVACLILLWALAPALRDPSAEQDRALAGRGWFWALGMLFAGLPFGATMPSNRLLLLLGLGGSALVGLAFASWRRGVFEGRGRRWTIGAILFCNFVVAPLLYYPIGASASLFETSARTLATDLPEDVELCVVINVPIEPTTLYPEAMRKNAGRAWPEHVYVLYSGDEELEVERVGVRALELRSEGGWARGQINRFTQSWDQRFEAGDRVALELAEVTVLEASEDGLPLRVRVDFDRDLDEIEIYGFGRAGAPGLELEAWRPVSGERERFRATL